MKEKTISELAKELYEAMTDPEIGERQWNRSDDEDKKIEEFCARVQDKKKISDAFIEMYFQYRRPLYYFNLFYFLKKYANWKDFIERIRNEYHTLINAFDKEKPNEKNDVLIDEDWDILKHEENLPYPSELFKSRVEYFLQKQDYKKADGYLSLFYEKGKEGAEYISENVRIFFKKYEELKKAGETDDQNIFGLICGLLRGLMYDGSAKWSISLFREFISKDLRFLSEARQLMAKVIGRLDDLHPLDPMREKPFFLESDKEILKAFFKEISLHGVKK